MTPNGPLTSSLCEDDVVNDDDGGEILRGDHESTVEYLRQMLTQETDASPLREGCVSSSQSVTSLAWRRKICEWCFEVADQ